MNQVSKDYEVLAPKYGDFLVNGKFTFEVEGKNKLHRQIKEIENSFIAFDEIERSFGNIIPLRLFSFLY